MKDQPHKDFLAWCNDARRASVEIWGYEGLIDDDPETALAHYLKGDSPTDYILALGEDMDLIKATRYWCGSWGI